MAPVLVGFSIARRFTSMDSGHWTPSALERGKLKPLYLHQVHKRVRSGALETTILDNIQNLHLDALS